MTRRRGWLLVCALTALGTAAQAAGDECLDHSEAHGRPIRAFLLKSRWNSLADVEYPVALNTPYSAEAASAALNAVRQRMKSEENAEAQTRGFLGVRYIEGCPMATADGGVDFHIRAYELRYPFGNPLSSLLPGLRSNLPSSVKGSPAALKLLDPRFGLERDRAAGLMQRLALKSDLRSAPRLLANAPPDRPQWTTPLEIDARRGLDSEVYEGRARFGVGREAPVSLLQQLRFAGEFESSRTPQGAAALFRNLALAGGKIQLRPQSGAFRQITLLPAYRWTNNRRIAEGNDERLTEDAFQLISVLDGSARLGGFRFATLVDAGSPRSQSGYRRLAAIAGWNGQVPLSKTHTNQTLGVEALFGAGGLWGTAPEYARFFAGNSGVDLLTAAPESAVMLTALTQPGLRSFGRAAAQRPGGGGSNSYWSLSLNLAVPIPKWSRPLIPREEVIGGVGLNEMVLRNGTRSAQSFLESYYENEEKLPPAEAARRAAREIGQIEPALRFIARRANLYSVKPLVMFDAVRLGASAGQPGRTFTAAGAGLQFTLVVARLEGGYLWTVNPRPGDNRGNLHLRLVFDNIF